MDKQAPIYKEFGDRLKDLRQNEELTQVEVATQLGIAQTTYAGYELGTRKIPLELIVKLSHIFHVSPDFLVLGEDNSPASVTPPTGDTKEDIKKYIGNLLISLGVGSPDKPVSEADQRLVTGILNIIEAYRQKETSEK